MQSLRCVCLRVWRDESTSRALNTKSPKLQVHVSVDLQKEALTKKRGWGFLGSRRAVDDLKDLQKGSAPTLTRQPSRVLKMKANLAR